MILPQNMQTHCSVNSPVDRLQEEVLVSVHPCNLRPHGRFGVKYLVALYSSLFTKSLPR